MIGVIYNTFVALYLMKGFYESFLEKRFDYLAREDYPENYNIMIRDIPIDAMKALAIVPGAFTPLFPFLGRWQHLATAAI